MSNPAAENHLGETEQQVVDSHVSDETNETQTETGHIGHEISLAAEPVFEVGNFTVTNSLLNTWLVVFLLIIISVVLKLKLKQIPKGIQNLFEIIIEGALSLGDSVTGDRKKTKLLFPLVFSIFMFILLNNWLGIFPGIGSIGIIETVHGHSTFIPYFRGATADLNTTLALALVTVIGSNLFGIITVGFWKYFNKFINLKALAEIPGKLRKDPTIIIVNPIKFFVGMIEIIGEIAKVASLSFRLFGNVFAGEVLLTSIAAIFAFGLPIPFMFLEVLVGVIQALIFAMLTIVYFTIAMTDEEH